MKGVTNSCLSKYPTWFDSSSDSQHHLRLQWVSTQIFLFLLFMIFKHCLQSHTFWLHWFVPRVCVQIKIIKWHFIKLIEQFTISIPSIWFWVCSHLIYIGCANPQGVSAGKSSSSKILFIGRPSTLVMIFQIFPARDGTNVIALHAKIVCISGFFICLFLLIAFKVISNDS